MYHILNLLATQKIDSTTYILLQFACSDKTVLHTIQLYVGSLDIQLYEEQNENV